MYRLEIFDINTGSFRAGALIDGKTPISFDYIAPQGFALKCNKLIVAFPFDLVRISDGNKIVFEGFLSTIKANKRVSDLTIEPMIKLVNYLSLQNTQYMSDWSQGIFTQLNSDFINNPPNLFNIGFTATENYSNWGTLSQPYESDLLNDMECIILAAEMYGKFMYFDIDPNTMKPRFSFLQTPPKRIIEADLENIISKQIDFNLNNGYNIAMIWYPDTDGNFVSTSAYKLPDGTISFNKSDLSLITEPRLTSKKVEKAFATSTEEQNALLEMLKPARTNSNIKLKVARGDKIIYPEQMAIGQPVDIITEGNIYTTILTRKTINHDTIDLIFGNVRHELTKKLKRR